MATIKINDRKTVIGNLAKGELPETVVTPFKYTVQGFDLGELRYASLSAYGCLDLVFENGRVENACMSVDVETNRAKVSAMSERKEG